MTTCTQCSLLSMRIVTPAQARAGWGTCTAQSVPADPMFVMYRRERVCDKMQPAPADIVAARVKWIDKING